MCRPFFTRRSMDGLTALHSKPTHPVAGAEASAAGQLALWSAANLAGMATGRLIVRERFFQRLINKLAGHRRKRVIRMRRPSPERSLPILADAVVGTSKATLFAVFGPPRTAVVQAENGKAITTCWLAQTWYYPVARHGPMAMAIRFEEDYASHVEFFSARA